MNLSSLFNEVIDKQELLSEENGYIGEASEVWRVQTKKEEVIVRTSRLENIENDKFWLGCKWVYQIDPRNVFTHERINRDLACMTSDLAVPKILRKAKINNKEYVVVEILLGKQLKTFLVQPDETMEDFGRSIAEIHRHHFPIFGNSTEENYKPLTEFHETLIQVMIKLVEKFYNKQASEKDDGIKESLDTVCEFAARLKVPMSASYIMVDMDPSQFLTTDSRITALIDTEGYVIGPREFDFIAFEYLFDQNGADAFQRGYASVLDLPDLTTLRPVYRYFYRLLSIQGSIPINKWMNQPILFK